MTTQNSSYSRIVAVWFVLLVFLCGMIVPSLALAKKEMTIDSEGDPGDGLESGGGGSGQEILLSKDDNFLQPINYFYVDDQIPSSSLHLGFIVRNLVIFPIFDGNVLYFRVIQNNSGQFFRGRN